MDLGVFFFFLMFGTQKNQQNKEKAQPSTRAEPELIKKKNGDSALCLRKFLHAPLRFSSCTPTM